ncbi:2OG-Fe(II) oxygenase family protein [Vibrio ostreicida]|uniref:2OG-Fe(II) oxygenase family protein n=1 Tax=Vibrio ostreicida TaxID=526588 RepID=A0ABT8BS71_9VIBR|nr:2OG-Fe(II) oxygenase family protein [Vibrio ostreicida]MDN3609504.1 2OG-Fe(II) oxygenase family protein [Vibrio ostreicida]NPD08384.1 isopenicillin N synthase family oxygenase [Vibrio ostreicida]
MKIIDIGKEQDGTAEEFTQALHQSGFVVLTNTGIEQEEIEGLYSNWLNFFYQTEESKQAFLYDKETVAGFIPRTVSETAKGFTKKDLKEIFHYYEGKPCPPEQQQRSDEIRQRLLDLSAKLLGWLNDYLPPEIKEELDEPLDSMAKGSPKTLFRMNYYPPMDNFSDSAKSGAQRAESHADINLITLLPNVSSSGLQAKTRDGQWTPVPYVPNSIVINSGDMLAMRTKDFYPSFYHRVIQPSNFNEERISLAFCVHPNDECKLSDQYTADSFLQERYKELKVK